MLVHWLAWLMAALLMLQNDIDPVLVNNSQRNTLKSTRSEVLV
jgi:hypothetical protein